MASRSRSRKKNKDGLFSLNWKGIGAVLILTFLIASYFIFISYNTKIRTEKYCVYIYTPSLDAFLDTLIDKNIIKSSLSLRLAAKTLNLDKVRPGLFEVNKDWNNIQFIYHLKNDSLKPSIKVITKPFRLRNNAVKEICKLSGRSYNNFNKILKDSLCLSQLNLNTESAFCLFIPNDFWLYRDGGEEHLLERLYSEYIHFWNDERLEKAQEIGYSPESMIVLASIVYSETKNVQEMPIIAGTYINRLKKRMKLESDPTVVFANKKFNIRRVFKKFTEVKSPYNTYRNIGLPPGPICIPSINAIEAVLNYSRHDFLYFCAKEDFSGCHNFSETYEEHLEKANKYRKMLNQKKIY